MSHPTRVRGLKLANRVLATFSETVAPYTGAWIEIKIKRRLGIAPDGRTLHGCVD